MTTSAAPATHVERDERQQMRGKWDMLSSTLAPVGDRSHIGRMSVRARVGWPFVVVATLLLTCLVTLSHVGRPGAPPFLVLHNRETVSWIAWLLLAPAIVAAATRFPFGEGPAVGWLWRHAALGAAFSIAGIVLAWLTATLIHSDQRGASGPPMVATFAEGVVLYALIAVSAQALAYHGAARARDAVAVRLRADLAEARLASLEGKLRPHFLFNVLNSIAALMREDPAQAERMLEQLSELLRATLRTNPTDEVSLDEALHLTKQYLAIEQVRYQERLRPIIEASKAARRGRVPPLILQPIVENAVRHGIAPLEAGGTIKVTAIVDEQTLVMTIEDDGVGFGSAPAEGAGTGLGLSSIRALLAHLYGAEQRFEIRGRRPSGTTVTIAVPYRTAAV
jgi:two-component system, LytTR family, sensor kinase